MMDFEDFVPALPSVLDRLRELGFQDAPNLDRFLMLAVHGKAVVRKSWVDEAEVSEAVREKLRELTEIEPDLSATEPRVCRTLDSASASAKVGRCRECFVKQGKAICYACGGSGNIVLSSSSEMKVCEACDKGWVACSACDGTGRSVSVRVHQHEDRTAPFAHVFVPEPVKRFCGLLLEFLKERAEIPECLRFDLNQELASRDAYRGRASEGEYRGHLLGSAQSHAQKYLERIERQPSVRKTTHTCQGWPFAVAVEGDRFALIAVDELLQTRVLSGGVMLREP